MSEKDKYMTKQGIRVKYTLAAKDNLIEEGLILKQILLLILQFRNRIKRSTKNPQLHDGSRSRSNHKDRKVLENRHPTKQKADGWSPCN